MDNIGDILNSLSDEDMQNLKGMAKQLFSSEGEQAAGVPDLGGMDIGMLTSLLKPREDERTKLIASLKPMLSEERRHRADEAIRLLHLASMLPALRESGILEKLLGDIDG
ncbi:MAG: hypothetical protein IKE65_09255 [Clostridia bacterium]|nr:hypothetical protein [Clostridia bacterium]